MRDGQVWQRSLCPTCECEPVLIAGDKDWYLREVLKTFPDHSPLKGLHTPRLGCPHDCGPCMRHASPCQLPVISVTNACNLACPVCINASGGSEEPWDMPPKVFGRMLDRIIEAERQIDVLNLSGGEPLLHPRVRHSSAHRRRPDLRQNPDARR